MNLITKKTLIVALAIVASVSSHAISICRNASNTVIYEQLESSSTLLAASLKGDRPVLNLISLKEHDVRLFDRVFIDTTVQGNTATITSSVKIEVTKKDGSQFDSSFLNLNEDQTAIRTTYICETTTDL